jgi:hypothetical protein
MEETIEAVKEIAKTTGQAVKSVDRLGRFFATVMGESIDATCGMLADSLKYKRWERQIKLVEKAEHLIQDKNLSNRFIQISPKLVLPIFQNASIEEDDQLHDLYAKLLVTAIDPEVQTRRTAFAEIIRQLEPIDVKILQAMYKVYEKKGNDYQENKEKYIHQSWFRENRPPTWTSILSTNILYNISISDSTYWESVDNLCRLGLADSYFNEDSIDIDTENDSLSTDIVTSHGGYDDLCITALGVAFVKICNY